MMVVITIVLVLAALSIGALMKATDWMKRSTTEQLMSKISTRLESLGATSRQQASSWDAPGQVAALAGNNPRRTKVIQQKWLLKWLVPQNFAEVLVNYNESLALYNAAGGHPHAARIHKKFFALDPNYATAAVPADVQAGACLLAIYEAMSTGDELSGNELGTFTYTRNPGNIQVTINYVRDAWETPIRVYRWPTGLRVTQAPFSDRMAGYAPPTGSAPDQEDAENLLYDNTWQTTTLSSVGYTIGVAGTTTCADEIEARFHPIRRNGNVTAVYAPMTLVSAGTDRLFGLALASATDPMASFVAPNGNPANERARVLSADEFDNLYTFRFRLGTRQQ
jgi:hypothetical protein